MGREREASSRHLQARSHCSRYGGAAEYLSRTFTKFRGPKLAYARPPSDSFGRAELPYVCLNDPSFETVVLEDVMAADVILI
jgi:hypothetical protein